MRRSNTSLCAASFQAEENRGEHLNLNSGDRPANVLHRLKALSRTWLEFVWAIFSSRSRGEVRSAFRRGFASRRSRGGVICPDASKAQNSIAAVSAPFDALEAARSGAPPLELLVQSLLVNLSNHDRMRRPPRRHCAGHLYIAVRPTPIIHAAASGISPSRIRRARSIQRLAIQRARRLFSCSHGIIDRSGHFATAVVFPLGETLLKLAKRSSEPLSASKTWE